MPAVTVERVPVQTFGLGFLGFDHLQIVFRHDAPGRPFPQDSWFVIEGLRETAGGPLVLGVEGWHGGTTLSEANGGLSGEALVARIGAAESRDPRWIADGAGAIDLWARLASYAADIAGQKFPYIAATLPGSPLPTINSSSLVASLLHHAGVSVEAALPAGMRFSPGLATLLGSSGNDTLVAGAGFHTLVGGAGDDLLTGSDDPARIDKLFGGPGNDVIRWSGGFNILHGGQPGLPYADDGIDTVDYSGAGVLRIEAPPASAGPTTPDFIVTHARGEDHLFSIEEIIWDCRSDRVIVGHGVALAPSPPRSETCAAETAEARPSCGAALAAGAQTAAACDTAPSHGPEDRLDLGSGEGGPSPLSWHDLGFDPGLSDLAFDAFDAGAVLGSVGLADLGAWA